MVIHPEYDTHIKFYPNTPNPFPATRGALHQILESQESTGTPSNQRRPAAYCDQLGLLFLPLLVIRRTPVPSNVIV